MPEHLLADFYIIFFNVEKAPNVTFISQLYPRIYFTYTFILNALDHGVAAVFRSVYPCLTHIFQQ